MKQIIIIALSLGLVNMLLYMGSLMTNYEIEKDLRMSAYVTLLLELFLGVLAIVFTVRM